jgi:hypothetical protein
MPSTTPLGSFVHSLRNLDHTRKRMEMLYQNQNIVLRDLHAVYEALFLRAVTSFEVFLEDLFISIVRQRTTYPAGRVSVRMTAISRQAWMDILLQNQDYMTWLPFSRTEQRAKIYLKDGKPFSDLNDGDKSMMKSITTIRNAIAHRGPHALNQFKKTVIASQQLLPLEKSPAGFLRSQVRASPRIIRFELYQGELARIANALS